MSPCISVDQVKVREVKCEDLDHVKVQVDGVYVRVRTWIVCKSKLTRCMTVQCHVSVCRLVLARISIVNACVYRCRIDYIIKF